MKRFLAIARTTVPLTVFTTSLHVILDSAIVVAQLAICTVLFGPVVRSLFLFTRTSETQDSANQLIEAFGTNL